MESIKVALFSRKAVTSLPALPSTGLANATKMSESGRADESATSEPQTGRLAGTGGRYHHCFAAFASVQNKIALLQMIWLN